MSRLLAVAVIVLVVVPTLGRAQVSGNAAYAQQGGRARAEQNERSKRVLTEQELPPSDTSMFVEASVLMNVKPDEFVAVFGIVTEGETLDTCNEAMQKTLETFTDALKPLGVENDDLFVDFVAQNRVYGLELLPGDIAREKLEGFELKKNVSIHYRDAKQLDKLVLAAAKAEIFDLVKVDTIVTDPAPIRERLMEEASKVIKEKRDRYENLLDISLKGPAQVYAERSSVYEPTEMYDSYSAFEAEGMSNASYRQRYTVESARKSRTFYFNGLGADGFDKVVNPVIVEPVVQFTLYLKVKYEVAPVGEK